MATRLVIRTLLHAVVPRPEWEHLAKVRQFEGKDVVGCMAARILADHLSLKFNLEITIEQSGCTLKDIVMAVLL